MKTEQKDYNKSNVSVTTLGVMCHSFTIMVLKQAFTDVESPAGSELCLRAVCLEKCGVAEHQSLQNDSSVNQRHSNVFEYTACSGDDWFFSPLFL